MQNCASDYIFDPSLNLSRKYAEGAEMEKHERLIQFYSSGWQNENLVYFEVGKKRMKAFLCSCEREDSVSGYLLGKKSLCIYLFLSKTKKDFKKTI